MVTVFPCPDVAEVAHVDYEKMSDQEILELNIFQVLGISLESPTGQETREAQAAHPLACSSTSALARAPISVSR